MKNCIYVIIIFKVNAFVTLYFLNMSSGTIQVTLLHIQTYHYEPLIESMEENCQGPNDTVVPWYRMFTFAYTKWR